MYYSSNPYKLTDYYPFGSPMPGRTFASSEGYKYGYQGSESDNEVKGSFGSHYTTMHRMLDTRLGRWFSRDPVKQPWQSPYTSMDNNPIALIDPLGLSTKGKGAHQQGPASRGRVVGRDLDVGDMTFTRAGDQLVNVSKSVAITLITWGLQTVNYLNSNMENAYNNIGDRLPSLESFGNDEIIRNDTIFNNDTVPVKIIKDYNGYKGIFDIK